jgi:hypothetical protein
MLGRYVVAQVQRVAELLGKFTRAHVENLVAFAPVILFARSLYI